MPGSWVDEVAGHCKGILRDNGECCYLPNSEFATQHNAIWTASVCKHAVEAVNPDFNTIRADIDSVLYWNRALHTLRIFDDSFSFHHEGMEDEPLEAVTIFLDTLC